MDDRTNLTGFEIRQVGFTTPAIWQRSESDPSHNDLPVVYILRGRAAGYDRQDDIELYVGESRNA